MALRSPLTVQPYDYIADSNGRPLDYGQVYIGVANQDPEFYQIPVYLDAAMTKPVDQPIRTNDGFVDFAGSLSELYASAEVYSVKVLDKQGRKVLYKGDMTRKNLMSDALADLNQSIIDTQTAAQITLNAAVNSANTEVAQTVSLATAAIDTATTKSNKAATDADAAIKTLFENGGLPATPFATKTLMTASALVDGKYAQVTDDTVNNGLYVKKSGAWVKSGYDPLLQSKIAVSKVDALSDSILNKSDNLFDASAATIGKYIADNGALVSKTTNSVSDYIPVTELTNYTMSSSSSSLPAFDTVNYFNKNKEYISRTVTTEDAGAQTIKTPENTAYIRLNIYGGALPAENERMFNEGVTAKPYDTYVKELSGIKVGADIVDYLRIALDYKDTDSARGYIVPSKNLFDYNKVTPNKLVSPTGEIVEPGTPNSYALSDFIAINGDTKYTFSGGKVATEGAVTGSAFASVAYYDADKNFITRVYSSNEDGLPKVITTPANAKYMRLNINAGEPSQYNRMVNIGEVAESYEKGGETKLDKLILSDSIINQISGQINPNPNNSKTFRFDNPVDAVFSTDQIWTGYTGFRTIKSEAVYAMYDALMAQHPDLITKHELGNDSIGNPIAYYKFTPNHIRMSPASDPAPKYPTIFIDCGMHGMEHMPPLATYLMLEQTYNNWQSDPLLEVLRHNVNFIVIPVSNPSGWNDFSRTNKNGVDINRNFPVNWVETPTGGTHSGLSPASELETQYVMQVFDENTEIDVYYNFHNFNGVEGETRYFYVSGLPENRSIINSMAQKLSGVLTRKWQKDYTWIPEYPYIVGFVVNGSGFGMAKTYGYSKGVYLSATFEIGEKWWIKEGAVAYDEIHCKTGMELITNWVLITLQELKRM